MRIAVIGDFHIDQNELGLTRSAMEDVARCSPDLVVPLGDFGTHENIGSREGLKMAHAFLAGIDAPIRPILGNHDLQRESGRGRQPKGTIERAMNRLFGLEQAYGVLEYDRYRLIFIGTDPQPEETCYQVQECYVNDERFAWLSRELKRRPGVPAILFTHAPPLGSGLRTVPSIHVRATNAYLDQNHDALRWAELAKAHKEIVMWFSAHYHLSHIYPDSCTSRFGTAFFTTGVHGSCTRDGNRHSRIVDLNDGVIQVFTLDHGKRTVSAAPDWRSDNAAVLSERPKPADLYLSGRRLSFVASCPIGDRAALPGGIIPLDADRCLVSTEDGFLWEVHHASEGVMGTLHWGKPLSAAAASEQDIWRSWDGLLVKCPRHSMLRFHREYPLPDDGHIAIRLDGYVTSLAVDGVGDVWAGCGAKLIRLHAQEPECVDIADDAIIRICPAAAGLTVPTASGNLFGLRREGPNRRLRLLERDVVAWDGNGEECAGIYHLSGKFIVAVSGPNHGAEQRVEFEPEFENGAYARSNSRILALGDGSVLMNINGCAFYWDATMETPVPLKLDGKTITASAYSVESGSAKRIYLATVSSEPYMRPQLEVWELR